MVGKRGCTTVPLLFSSVSVKASVVQAAVKTAEIGTAEGAPLKSDEPQGGQTDLDGSTANGEESFQEVVYSSSIAGSNPDKKGASTSFFNPVIYEITVYEYAAIC